jgi:hypothetical protein
VLRTGSPRCGEAVPRPAEMNSLVDRPKVCDKVQLADHAAQLLDPL